MEAKKKEQEFDGVSGSSAVVPDARWKLTQSLEDHERVLRAILARADALDPATVRKLDRPMPVLVQEAVTISRAARRAFPELSLAGLLEKVIEETEEGALACHAYHVLSTCGRAARKSEELQALLAEARAKRDDGVAAVRLAFRKRPDAARVAVLQGGTSTEELVTDLSELSAMCLAWPEAFTAIGVDPRKLADEATSLAAAIREALAAEEALRRLSESRGLRDRLYTLVQESIEEIRARADFAFRSDKTGRKRAMFASKWAQKKNRKAKARREAEAEADAANDATTEPAAEVA